MAEEHFQLPHKLTLDQRKQLHLTGVTEILRFDDSCVAMKTSMGTLVVHGSGLQLKTLSLDGGQVAVSGTVEAMIYQQQRPAGFWKRLFS